MKKLLAIFSLIFVSCFAFTSLATAAGPRFNFLEGDYKTIRGANFTKNETTWHDPVDGDVEDIINWTIYIHNGKEGTTAENVTVGVELPVIASQSHNLKAVVSADNAQGIEDMATLNLANEGILEYLPGTTTMYDRNGTEIKSLPDGITSGGINIGEIKGCWPYVVFIVFKTQVKTQEIPSIIKKGEVLGAKTLPVTGSPITVSFALAFLGTSVYYLIQEDKLFKSAFLAVRTI